MIGRQYNCTLVVFEVEECHRNQFQIMVQGKWTEMNIWVRWQEKNPSVKTRVPWGVSDSQNSDQTLYIKDTKMYLMVKASTASLYSGMYCQQFIHQSTSGKNKKDFIHSPCNLLACISLDSVLPVFLSLQHFSTCSGLAVTQYRLPLSLLAGERPESCFGWEALSKQGLPQLFA